MIGRFNKFFVLFLNTKEQRQKLNSMKFSNLDLVVNSKLLTNLNFFDKKLKLINRNFKFGLFFTNNITDLALYLKLIDFVFSIKIDNKIFLYTEKLNVFLYFFFFSKFFFIIFFRFFFVNIFHFKLLNFFIVFNKNNGYMVSSSKTA